MGHCDSRFLKERMMGMVALTNAFSLTMIHPEKLAGGVTLDARELSLVQAKAMLTRLVEIEWENDDLSVSRHREKEFSGQSYIGHEDTARLLSGILGVRSEIPVSRDKFVFSNKDEMVVVAQYLGPRLPEGATELPEGAEVRFYRVLLLQSE